MKNAKRVVAFLLAMLCVLTTTMKPLSTKAAETQEGSRDVARTIVQFEGAGGAFSYETMEGFSDSAVESIGSPVEVGKPVSSVVKSILDPVFFDASRTFLGWELCILEEVIENGDTYVNWVPMPGTKLFTTKEVLEYIAPKDYTEVQFTAKWDGEDEQYYTDISFDLYGGTMKIVWHEGEQNDVSEVISSWSRTLRIDGNTLKDQIEKECDLSATPTKDGAIFEGWLEFKTEDDDSYELVSDKLYTSDEILNRVVSSYHVVYAAKWSDMKVEDYYSEGQEKPGEEGSNEDEPWIDDPEITY